MTVAAVVLQHHLLLQVALIAGGQPVQLGGGDFEAGVRHAQGLEQRGAHEIRQALAAEHLDQVAQHIGSDGVVPALPRGELQRQPRQLVDHLLQGIAPPRQAHAQFPVGRVDVAGMHEVVGQPGGVHEQVADGHGALAGRRGEQRVRTGGAHPQLFPGGNIAVHGIVQGEQAALVQDHQGDGGHRLGHGVDAHDGVGGHGRAPLHIPQARHVQVAGLAAPGDQRNAAGDLARLHVTPAQVLSHALQLGAVHSDRFRRDQFRYHGRSFNRDNRGRQ